MVGLPYSALVHRVLLDSNAIDVIADTAGIFELAEAAVEAGTHEFLFTHVNIDELAEIPDLDRRQWLLLLLVAIGKLVPTGACAVDYSRLNFCRLTDDADVFEAIQSGNLKNTRDALLASTAVYEHCTLATNDARLRRRAEARDVAVIGLDGLVVELKETREGGSTASAADG